MSSRREKVRAVFLAAVMVVSVVGMSAAFAGSAAAQTSETIVVDDDGGSGVDYTSLNDAINNADENDTIDLRAGEYNLSTDVGVNNLTITGPNAGILGNSTERNAEAAVTVSKIELSADNVTIDGLLFTGSSDGFINVSGSGATFENLVAETDGTSTVRLYSTADDAVITNNLFNGDGGNWIINAHQGSTPVDGVEITNNVFRNADKSVIQAKYTNGLISGNTFNNVGEDAIRLVGNVDGTEVTENNIQNTGLDPKNASTPLLSGIVANSPGGTILITDNTFENNRYHLVRFGTTGDLTFDSNSYDSRIDVSDVDVASELIAGEIQPALNYATKDSIVDVGPGTYNESVTIDTANVTLASTAGADETTIVNEDSDGNAIKSKGDGLITARADNVVIDGFTVKTQPEGTTLEGGNTDQVTAAVLATGDNVKVRNNILQHNEISAGNPLVELSGGSAAVDNNVIDSGLLYLPSATNAKVTANSFQGNFAGETISTYNQNVGNLVLNRNDFRDADTGDDYVIQIYNNSGAASINVNNNSFSAGQNGIDNQDSEMLNATANWWGDASGPSGAANGDGAAVSANVTYTPWLDAPVPDGEPVYPTAESVTVDAEFVGAVDDGPVPVTVTNVTDEYGEPVTGTVNVTIGGTHVGEVTVEDGDSVADATVDPTALDATTEPGEYAVSLQNVTFDGATKTVEVADGTVDVVHEVRTVEDGEGWTGLSVPQPATLSFDSGDGEGDIATYNESAGTYDNDPTIEEGELLGGEQLHQGMYAAAEGDDLRVGYTFETESLESPGSVPMDQGWHLVSTNFDISDRAGNDTFGSEAG